MAARQPSLKLDREKGEIANLEGEAIHVRRMRDGEQIYVAPSTEAPICIQKQKITERVGVNWDGDRCTAAEDMAVEIRIAFAIERPRTAPKAGQIPSASGDL